LKTLIQGKMYKEVCYFLMLIISIDRQIDRCNNKKDQGLEGMFWLYCPTLDWVHWWHASEWLVGCWALKKNMPGHWL